jgi:DNA-binding XRE family transcriptional regulator
MKHITAITATIKLKAMINSNIITKVNLAQKLDIQRTTLDKRLKTNSWKKGELEIIKTL